MIVSTFDTISDTAGLIMTPSGRQGRSSGGQGRAERPVEEASMRIHWRWFIPTSLTGDVSRHDGVIHC